MRNRFVLAALAIMTTGCAGPGSRPSITDRARLRDAIARADARVEAFVPLGPRSSPSQAQADDAAPGPSAGTEVDKPLLVASLEASATTAPASAEPGEIRRGPPGRLIDSMRQDFSSIFRDVWQDTKRVYTDPANLGILLAAGGASGALRPEVDDDIEDKFDRAHSFKADIRDALGVVGNPITHFGLAGLWYLLGTETGDTKTYEVAKTLFSGLIINGVSTMGLKLAANTESPNGENLAWPSGHTSSAFTFAAILHQAYGHAVGIPLYGLAGLAAFERLDDREHDFSDVAFGAALGLVVGHTVATGHRPQIFGGDLIPFADANDNSGGIAWMKGF